MNLTPIKLAAIDKSTVSWGIWINFPQDTANLLHDSSNFEFETFKVVNADHLGWEIPIPDLSVNVFLTI